MKCILILYFLLFLKLYFYDNALCFFSSQFYFSSYLLKILTAKQKIQMSFPVNTFTGRNIVLFDNDSSVEFPAVNKSDPEIFVTTTQIGDEKFDAKIIYFPSSIRYLKGRQPKVRPF